MRSFGGRHEKHAFERLSPTAGSFPGFFGIALPDTGFNAPLPAGALSKAHIPPDYIRVATLALASHTGWSRAEILSLHISEFLWWIRRTSTKWQIRIYPATITIGGLIGSSLKTAFGETGRYIDRVNEKVRQLNNRQKELNRIIRENEKDEKRRSGVTDRLAREELADLDKQIAGLKTGSRNS